MSRESFVVDRSIAVGNVDAIVELMAMMICSYLVCSQLLFRAQLNFLLFAHSTVIADRVSPRYQLFPINEIELEFLILFFAFCCAVRDKVVV